MVQIDQLIGLSPPKLVPVSDISSLLQLTNNFAVFFCLLYIALDEIDPIEILFPLCHNVWPSQESGRFSHVSNNFLRPQAPAKLSVNFNREVCRISSL
jgi:hypothetical protein